jgi:hypothetical protein
VHERTFVAPEHASIRIRVCGKADPIGVVHITITGTMIVDASGLERAGYVQVGFSRSVRGK